MAFFTPAVITQGYSYVCGSENPCGLHIVPSYDLEANLVRADMVLPPDPALLPLASWPSHVHPGIVISLVDEVVGSLALLKAGYRAVVTANINLSMHAPVPWGRHLRLQGRLTAQEGRKLFTSCRLLEVSNGALLVSGRMLFVILSEEKASAMPGNITPEGASPQDSAP
ncbi:MAG: PaaI family thioesterase [Desulfarculales bacterium]|jgi:hypothetical protein|nr:PaaI family thioesterase [Desulfarculales bacterium]